MDQDLQHRHILGIPIISLGPKGQLRLGIWPSYSTGTSWEIPVMFLGQIGQIGPRIWQYLAHGYWEFPYVLTTSKANRVTWTWDVNTAQGHVGNSSWKTGTVQCPGILASLGTATVVPNCPSVLWCPKNPGICDGNPGQPWPSTFLLYNCRRSRGWMWGNLWRLDGQDTKVHMHLQCIEYQFSDTMCLFLCMLIGSEIYLLFTSLYFTCCSYKAERSRYWPAQLVLPGTLW